MNRNESGAAELFKFRETDEFVDFVLKLVIDSKLGNQVSSNLEAFGTELRRRSEEFLPERELICGVMDRLKPLVGLAYIRSEVYCRVTKTQIQLHHFLTYLSDRDTALNQEVVLATQQGENARHDALRLQEEARLCQQRAIFFRYLAAQERVKQLTTDYEQLSAQAQKAQRDELIWKAAIPLSDLIRTTHEVTELQAQIKNSEVEHTPLRRKLETAARKYKAALRIRLEHLREEETSLTQTEREARQKAVVARDEASSNQNEAAVFEEKARHVANQIDELHQARFRLEELGTFHAGENWENAYDRLTRQHTLQDKEQRAIQHVFETLEQETLRINETTAGLIRAEADAAKLEAEARKELEMAQIERQAIEQDEYLQRYLELEIIDISRLDASATAQLHRTERSIEQRVLTLWSALIDQEYAINHLKEHELLPPSHDVKSILEVLHDAGVIAWSGWEYMSRNVSPANARDFIQQAPELVLGVVIQNSHYEQAQKTLSSAKLNLNVPVVVGHQSDIEREGVRTAFMIGPTSDAYFDRNAAQIELGDRQSKYVQEQQNLNAIRFELTKLRESTSRLEKFRQQYPNSWIQERQESIDTAVEQQQAYQAQFVELVQEQQKLKSEIACQRQRQHSLMEELSILREHIARLQEYAARFSTELSILEQYYTQLRYEVKSKQDAANHLIADAKELEQQAVEASVAVKKTLEKASVTNDEISRIKYCEGKLPVLAGDVQILSQSYNQHLAFYEGKVSASTLHTLLDRAKRDEHEARQKFTSKLQKGIDEKVVRAALNPLLDGSDVERRCEEAVKKKFEAERLLKDNDTKLKQAQQELNNCKQECARYSLMEKSAVEEFLENGRNFDLSTDEEESRVQELEVIANQRRVEAQSASTLCSELQHQIEVLIKDRKRIETLVSIHSDLLGATTNQLLQESDWTAPLDKEIDSRLDRLEQQLKQAQQELFRLDDIRNSVKHTVHKWIDDVQFKHGKLDLIRRLKLLFEEDYERHCTHLQSELTLRLQQIEVSLLETDAHRDKIVEHTLAAAKVGIRVLKLIESRSKLPSSLQSFGEKSFLKITLHDSTDPVEMKACIEVLIDEIVNSGRVPAGIELVQQAVRRLAKPIHIRILFPDPDSVSQYIPITEMTKQSGGERLTSAILLYCTLAQLRARERGQKMASTSTLLLDNPIGKASRPKFLELQREVARAMNIQLIYTTGVNDFEAIRMLPNVIRLRNDRLDQSKNERLLEIAHDNYIQESQLLFLDNQVTLEQMEPEAMIDSEA